MELKFYLANFCEYRIISVVVDIFYSVYFCTHAPTITLSAAIIPASTRIVEDGRTGIQQAPTTNGKHTNTGFLSGFCSREGGSICITTILILYLH